jgi:type VI secretion system protein VasD
MAVKAAPDVNPDLAGTPQPVRVRVFQLTSPNRLTQVTYFQLDKDPKAALGDTFKAMDERVLRPGETWSYRAKPDDAVRFVGIVASYQDIDHASWRAAKDIQRNATTFLDADIGAKAVTIKEAAP